MRPRQLGSGNQNTEATHENTAALNFSGQDVDATHNDTFGAGFSGPGASDGAGVLAAPRVGATDVTAPADDASAAQSPSLPHAVGVPTLGADAVIPAEATPGGRNLGVVAFDDLVSTGLGRLPLPVSLPSVGSADVSIGAGVSEAPLRRMPQPPEPAAAAPPRGVSPPSTHPAIVIPDDPTSSTAGLLPLPSENEMGGGGIPVSLLLFPPPPSAPPSGDEYFRAVRAISPRAAVYFEPGLEKLEGNLLPLRR